MVDIKGKKECCGCTACAAICPHDAITMQPDRLGFLYPSVDKQRCVDCGLCLKVCSFSPDYDKSHNLEMPYAYGARHKDMSEVESSRSGGAFIALSDLILERGGVVYGVGYVDHFRAAHKRATTKAERDEFKGSKYVQSDLSGVFPQVKADLKAGLEVLFSGTPCQTSGLLAYVGEKLRSKLYVIDLICHGVPSPYVWRDYVAHVEQNFGKRATQVSFRDKTNRGWSAHVESFTFDNNVYYSDVYTYLFYEHIMFRQSCGNCYFTNTNRPSDMTIADFWGWQKVDAEFNRDDKGCSLLFCNSQKGVEWFDKIRNRLNVIETPMESCMQPNLEHPSLVSPNREKFEQDFEQRGFEYILERYGNVGWRYVLREKTKYVSRLPMRVIRLAKRIVKKVI